VYSGLPFQEGGSIDASKYDIYEPDYTQTADFLANGLILASGKYEIGPRALGNRSILAAPFRDTTRIRLNEIKQREQFRPIAPVCLRADARKARRAKTDRIDGEILVRALMAFKRGEPRPCAMVRVPSPDEEDRRRLVRERKPWSSSGWHTPIE
jgi:hypothetical protein